eukprot:2578613-Alexandrium_andersonii.AAC.1
MSASLVGSEMCIRDRSLIIDDIRYNLSLGWCSEGLLLGAFPPCRGGSSFVAIGFAAENAKSLKAFETWNCA